MCIPGIYTAVSSRSTYFRTTTVVVGLIPAVGTTFKPVRPVRADEIADKSPLRGREARVPCGRHYGRREPSRALSCIYSARNCQAPRGSRVLE